MNDDFFSLQRDGAVAHLQLNRPERMNTMTPAFFPALRDAVRGLQDDAQTRALVISWSAPAIVAVARCSTRAARARA